MPTVLIADDDPSLRLLVGATLASSGFRLLETKDGDEAWRALQAEQPDIAVLDVVMPGATGFELTKRIRAQPELSAMRVILLTGSDRPGGSMEGRRAGADLYLTKPFSPQVLFDAVTCDFAIPAEDPGVHQLGQLRMHPPPAAHERDTWRAAFTVHIDPPPRAGQAAAGQPPLQLAPVNWPGDYIDERELASAIGSAGQGASDGHEAMWLDFVRTALDEAHRDGRIKRFVARNSEGSVVARAYRRDAVRTVLAGLAKP